MNEPGGVRGVVVAHGALASGLVDAVRQITGELGDALVPLSNAGRSPDSMIAEVRSAVGEGPAIIFADLPSGSCAFAARRLGVEREGVAVVCGVNLPLLLDFVTHRELPLETLVPRLLQRGRGGITCAPGSLESHDDRTVSRG